MTICDCELSGHVTVLSIFLIEIARSGSVINRA